MNWDNKQLIFSIKRSRRESLTRHSSMFWRVLRRFCFESERKVVGRFRWISQPLSFSQLSLFIPSRMFLLLHPTIHTEFGTEVHFSSYLGIVLLSKLAWTDAAVEKGLHLRLYSCIRSHGLLKILLVLASISHFSTLLNSEWSSRINVMSWLTKRRLLSNMSFLYLSLPFWCR